MKKNLSGKVVFSKWNVAFALGLVVSMFSLHCYAVDNDDLVKTNSDRRPIEELFKTDTVFPQDQGELETEVATFYQRNTIQGDTFSVPLSVEFGLTDNWQVEAEWNSYVQHSAHKQATTRGIGDLEVGTQYSFLNIGDSLFHVAPRFSVEVPLGDVNKDLSEGFLEFEPAVVLARDFPELHHTELFTEVGLGFVHRVKWPADADDAEPSAHELQLGAGFFTLFDKGAFTMEFNWVNNQWNHGGMENTAYITPGVLWRPTQAIEVGVGIPVGLNRQSDVFEVLSHFTIEF